MYNSITIFIQICCRKRQTVDFEKIAEDRARTAQTLNGQVDRFDEMFIDFKMDKKENTKESDEECSEGSYIFYEISNCKKDIFYEEVPKITLSYLYKREIGRNTSSQIIQHSLTNPDIDGKEILDEEPRTNRFGYWFTKYTYEFTDNNIISMSYIKLAERHLFINTLSLENLITFVIIILESQ